MAEPVDFEQSNFTFTTPAGMTEEECGNLPCLLIEDQRRVISCYKMTPEELKEVARTGVVWVDVYAFPVPPIAIAGQKPFGVKEGCPQCGTFEWGEFQVGGDIVCDCGYVFPGGEML